MATTSRRYADELTSTDSSAKKDYGLQMVAASSYFVLSLTSLAVYGIFLKIFTRVYRAQFAGLAFYRLATHLIIANVAFLLLMLVVPVTYTVTNAKVQGWPNDLLCGMSTFYYFAVTAFSVLIAVDRLVCFTSLRLEVLLFSGTNLSLITAGGWLFAFYHFSVTTFFGCHKDFDLNTYSYLYNCTATDGTTPPAYIVLHARLTQMTPGIAAIAIMIIYIVLVIYLVAVKNPFIEESSSRNLESQQRSEGGWYTWARRIPTKYDRELCVLIQGMLIGGSMLISDAAFVLQVNGVVFMWSAIVICALTPVIFLIFNGVIRREFLNMLGKTPATTPVSTIQR